MAQFKSPIALPGPKDCLETVVGLLARHRESDYWTYEHKDTWYVGIRNQVSLVVDCVGKKATIIDRDGKEESQDVSEPLNDVARKFIAQYTVPGVKIFGQVAFNYHAHIAGQAYNPGTWPLLLLVVPSVQVTVSRDRIMVAGFKEEEADSLVDLIHGHINSPDIVIPESRSTVDVQTGAENYKSRVAQSIEEIKQGKYTKAIPSRMVNLPDRVDMPATLFHGRRANTPARTFSFKHRNIQATGFSPEVLVSIDCDTIFTEALAGTQLAEGADMEPTRHKLLNDPKEVNEHVIAIRGSMRRLGLICPADSIAVKNFMTVMPRGNVQHLFSHVCGQLTPGKDGWDALPGLVANITVPGLPGQSNMDAIRCFEHQPRDLYCGAALILDHEAGFFDATLVLRTVFQDQTRQWLQAGAGVTAYSNPEREFMETCEKLGSVVPHVIAEVVKG
ncbi:putative salicylate synthetase [Aspergillus steynii IBT 23096]|uniref:Putative salicylate synthetase n=1 Tax=Aspergillus steynii IBT 23096 TaxID=1392250 RepID=A0A2I2GFC8_9EURO|nr:putative salicylate synthetase [Aspergillus steynii IBT 23096]PLB51561.1 putative salicylate synthetase [Aspergillus steynii IBT 23096]